MHALRGVSFAARSGELIGLIGTDGSGKSTLLRLIAGVEKPDCGEILASKQPVLLGVNATMHPALSGEQNVKLGYMDMGMMPQQATENFEHIVELSALRDATRRPMGTYSSGIGARLRFAIAAAASPSILLVDEALSTGDAAFAERSKQAVDGMLEKAGTVIMVNNATNAIQEMCSRAIWLHEGAVIMDGVTEDVAERYRWWAWNVAQGEDDVARNLLAKAKEDGVSQSVERLDIDDMELQPRDAARVAPNPRHERRAR